MAMYKSNYLDNKILNMILNGAAFTPPATLYFALFTTRPAADGTGGVEVAGGLGYARIAVTPNTTNFPTTTTESCANGTLITFGTPTGSWGTLQAIAIMDAPSGGNFLYIGDLAAPTAVSVGTGAPVFIIGAITVTEV